MTFSQKINQVWILPLEIAGFGAGVQRGFDTLGIRCQILDLSGNPYSYEFEGPESFLARTLAMWHKFGSKQNMSLRRIVALASLPLRILFVLVHFRRDTLVVVVYGNSLLRGWDLAYARFVGGCVITVFLGSDSRPPYLNGVWMNPEGTFDIISVNAATKKVRQTVTRAERNSDRVICSPSTAHFLQRDFVNWFHIGIATIQPEKSPSSSLSEPKREHLRIAHAPSHPKCKGTKEIIEALNILWGKGFAFEFVLLQNESNANVQETLLAMDLVIDELYSDTFMGGLGVEAAKAGVPCLTFGLAGWDLAKWTEGTSAPLAGYSDPDSLLERIEWAITDEENRIRLGTSQHSFYESNWAPEEVAGRLLLLASGICPRSWLFSPSEVDYVWGFGMSKDVLLPSLQSYVNAFGHEGLLLNRDAPFVAALSRAQAKEEGLDKNLRNPYLDS